jgi:serine/threonine protein kinase
MADDLTKWDDEIAIHKEISGLLNNSSPRPPLKWTGADATHEAAFEHARRIWLPDIPCLKKFRLLMRIGSGAKSVVYRARNLDTAELCAIKVVDVKSLNTRERKNVYNEVAILRGLIDAPDVLVHLLQLLDVSPHLCLVQRLSHTDLYHELVRRGKFSEVDAKLVLRNLITAIDFLHVRGIVHRDVKLENILVEYEYDYADNVSDRKIRRVILADFGLAKQLGVGTTTTPCGTMEYAAPEVLQQEYNKAVDLWGMGCVLYTLLCGFAPFHHDDPHELVRLISTATFSFPSPYWDDVSDDAKQVVSGLFRMEPQRWTTRDLILSHWMKREDKWLVPATLHTPASEVSFRNRNATNGSAGSGVSGAVERTRELTISTLSSDPAFSGKRGGRRTSLGGWVMPLGVLHTPVEASPGNRSPAARSPLVKSALRPESPMLMVDLIRQTPPDKLHSPLLANHALPPPMTSATMSQSSFASALSLASPKSADSKSSRLSKESDYFEHGTLRKKRFDERAVWEKSNQNRHHRRAGGRTQAPFEAVETVEKQPGQLFVSPSDLSPLQDSVIQPVSGSRWREEVESEISADYASAISSHGHDSLGRGKGSGAESYVTALSQGLIISTPISLPTPLNKHSLDASYWAARALFDPVDGLHSVDSHASQLSQHSQNSQTSHTSEVSMPESPKKRTGSPTSPRVTSLLPKEVRESPRLASKKMKSHQPFELKMSESTLLNKRMKTTLPKVLGANQGSHSSLDSTDSIE